MAKQSRRGAQINADWFRKAISDVGKTQADLARHLQIEASQISKMFAGGRRVQLDEVEQIASFINKPVREVLINLGVRLEEGATSSKAIVRKVPVVGDISQEGIVTIDLEKAERQVETPGFVPTGTAAVVVPANMADGKLAMSGLYFFVVPDKVDPAAIGRLAIVRQARGPWLLRTVRPGIEPGRYDLVGPAGREEGQELIAAGPILYIRP